MLIRLIKRDDLFGLFLIPAAGALFWLKSFISPPDISGFGENGAMPLYSLVYGFLERLPSLHVFIAFILVAWNSFLITRLSSTFLLFRKGSRLPGIIYMFVISSWKILQCLHPVHIATFFILAAIFNIFKTYQKELEIGLTFNASFLLAIASLFYFPSAILLPVIWISIFVLQKSDNWRLLVVPIFGFIVPWLLAFSVYYMKDSLGPLLSTINEVVWADNNDYLLDTRFLIISGLMIFLVLLGSFFYLTNYQFIKISSRKYFFVFYWMLGLVGLSALSFTTIGIEIIALSTFPAAFLISVYFLSGEKYFWREIFFIIFISLLVIGNQIN